MARNIPANLEAHMQQEVTTLAQCLIIERVDGRRVLLTNHDSAVTFDGENYAAAPSFTSSAIKVSADLSTDNVTITLGLDEVIFKTSEFQSSIYDDAEFELFLISWENPEYGAMQLTHGWVKEINLIRGRPQVEIKLRGITQLLNRPFMETYSLTCRAAFGDHRCQYAISPYDNPYRGNVEISTGHWVIEPVATTSIPITNPSFEADGAVASGGVISGWTVALNSEWTVEDSVGGWGSTYALVSRVEQKNRLFMTFATSGVGMTNVNIDDGGYIADMRIWAKALAATSGEARLVVFFFDDQGDTIRIKRGTWTTLSDQYEQIVVAHPVSPNTRTIKMQIETRGDSAIAEIAFDECTARFWESSVAAYTKIYKAVKLLGYSAYDLALYPNYQFNADGEVGHGGSGISDWTYTAGEWAVKQTAGALHSTYGGYFLYGATGVDPQLTQEYDLASISDYTANNPTGYFCELAVDAATDGVGQVMISLEYKSSSGATIETFSTAMLDLSGTWERFKIMGEVPQNAATVTMHIYAGSAQVAVDRAALYLMSQYLSDNNDVLLQRTGETFPTLSSITDDLSYDSANIVWKTRDVPFEFGRVVNVTDNSIFDISSVAADTYGLGSIEFISGNNAGLKFPILKQENDTITLFQLLPFNLVGNDKFIIYPTCNKTIDTCAYTYDNAINFRGEPFIPGNVKVTDILG